MTADTITYLDVKVVYVHGFRGSVRTFANFPQRLGEAIHPLDDDRHRNVRVDAQIYPYETRGRYTEASQRLDTELRTLITTQWKGCSALAIILVGHSMGGLVAADAIRYIYNKGHPLPNNAEVIGLLGYDTPYFSLDQGFVRSAFRDLTLRPWTWGLQMIISSGPRKESWWQEAAVNIQGAIKDAVCPDAIRETKPIRTLATTSSLLGLLGYYTYRELTYKPIGNDDNGSYLNKLYEYLIFAKETFGSSELQEQR
ncbi:hypothetical protein BJV82DRAFT_612325 [Fennellomyces sp. T-0311]|nr:hypothetical protein BJV82DRAFT_612325 [Fennellomyces sp. T-0311]